MVGIKNCDIIIHATPLSRMTCRARGEDKWFPYILYQNCLMYSTLDIFQKQFPFQHFNCIILKVYIKHIMYFSIFTAYKSLSTFIFTYSVVLLPETFLHVLKNAILKPNDVMSSVHLKYVSIKSSTEMFFLQICHVWCCTVYLYPPVI